MVLTLTAQQRINIGLVIRAQQPPTFEQIETLGDILGKIDFPDDIKDSFYQQTTIGGVMDKEKMKEIPDLEVSLEKAEGRLLKQILEPNERFKPGVGDLPWLKPIRVQLSQAS